MYPAIRFMKRKFAGFTLAELIVVITILAILATIGFLALSGYSQDAKDSATKANVRSVQTAISSESAVTNNSPRYYVIHNTGASLSGAFVYLDGTQTTLTGGDWNAAWTNYSAGNPDYAKLKLNPEKFKTASLPGLPFAFSRFVPSAFAAYGQGLYDSKYLTVGAMESVISSGSKPRSTTFFQVAGISSVTGKATVAGNFPSSVSMTGSVVGLIAADVTKSATGALVDGSVVWVPPPALVCSSGYANVSGICVPMTCKAIKTSYPASASGPYSIDADGAGPNPSFSVYCDMTTDGGGWTNVNYNFGNVVALSANNGISTSGVSSSTISASTVSIGIGTSCSYTPVITYFTPAFSWAIAYSEVLYNVKSYPSGDVRCGWAMRDIGGFTGYAKFSSFSDGQLGRCDNDWGPGAGYGFGGETDSSDLIYKAARNADRSVLALAAGCSSSSGTSYLKINSLMVR